MIILNCSKKLLDELPNNDSNIIPLQASIHGLKDWYAHLIKIGRKKYLIFLNSETLFTFYSKSIKKKDFQNLEKIFRDGLKETLLNEVSEDASIIEKVIKDSEKIIIRRNKNRSAQGSLNEVNQQLKATYEHENEIDDNRDKIIHNLNSIPMQPIKWKYPVVKLKEELGLKV